MAIYHCSVKNISRSGGKSAVASAAYRAGEKIEDIETGLTHDYTKKKEVVYSEIFLCENAPNEYQDRATLWNEVQKVEVQSDARLAREWEVALPNELTLEQSKELIKEYSKSLVNEGMCIDASIHWKDGNHHAHIMGTTRAIKDNGEWAPKSRKVYDLDEHGERIPQIDKKTGLQKVDKQNRKQWKTHKEEFTDWNKTEKVEEWRERWAEHCNKALEKSQSSELVDHRSYERQGIEKIPTLHEGYIARKIEARGGTSEVCSMNRQIKSDNNLLEQINHKIQEIIEKVRDIVNDQLNRLRGNRGTDEPVRETEGNHKRFTEQVDGRIRYTKFQTRQFEGKRAAAAETISGASKAINSSVRGIQQSNRTIEQLQNSIANSEDEQNDELNTVLRAEVELAEIGVGTVFKIADGLTEAISRDAEREKLLEERSSQREEASKRFYDKLRNAAIGIGDLKGDQQAIMGQQQQFDGKIGSLRKEQSDLGGSIKDHASKLSSQLEKNKAPQMITHIHR